MREHPGLETPLRRLASDLAGAERLLDDGFTAPAESMQTIGPYRVLDIIGEGAFGVVYRCAQDVPVKRELAVKVLRPGAGDRHTLARFEAERHVLARLSHAAIAQVFDAGSLPDGRPWFAMEYVRGLPISTWCDQRGLGIDRGRSRAPCGGPGRGRRHRARRLDHLAPPQVAVGNPGGCVDEELWVGSAHRYVGVSVGGHSGMGDGGRRAGAARARPGGGRGGGARGLGSLAPPQVGPGTSADRPTLVRAGPGDV